MARLPRGNVTLVCTDIEGSTSLLHELGERYIDVLRAHNARLRNEMYRHGGIEVRNVGDGFLFTFTDTSAAVTACTRAAYALRAGRWPHGCDVRVRFGIHRGDVVVLENDYVGLAAHEASRVCSAARGGQILVTDAVVEKARGVAAEHAGSFELKGFIEPRDLYEVCA